MSTTVKHITAVIIDDEKGARDSLRTMLQMYCEGVTVLGEADNVERGRALILEVNPDLIFLDVEMPPATGFDLIRSMDALKADIIFITAHNHYAINAIKLSALDYLLKPVNRLELMEAVKKHREKEGRTPREVLDLLRMHIDSKKETERLVIASLQGLEIIKVSDIIYCEGERNYTTFHLTGKEALLSSKTLKEYETLLPSSTFIRVHQKYLVNINYVKKYLKGRGGTLIMSNGQSIEVSQSKKQIMLDALG
jgi:two-component system, LytTR family, response regulator